MSQKKSILPLTLLGLFLSFSPLLFSQNKLVTGAVQDKDGVAVAGASVTVKGTNKGTNTDAAGNFSISVPASAKTLGISSVGYAGQDVAIGDGKLNVVLQPATANDLNEVVVVGYGTARKRDVTGAVGSVTAKQFNTGQINSPEQLLQGKVPGLQITNSSGQPGGLTIVRIRGNNSIRSGNNPLYVVDGIPLDGRTPRPGFTSGSAGTSPPADALTFINPNEIAKVDVLKDASASAIYGSRGANGVVLITTKKGVAGPARLEFNSSVGVGSVMRKIKVLDAAGYRAAIQKYGVSNTDSGANVDPFGEITRSAPTQNYSLALSGGNENGKYRASFFIGDQDGIILKTNLKKYVGNFNGQYKFLDKKLSLDFSVTTANVAEDVSDISQDAGSTGNIISLALNWNPTLALKRNGQYFQENKAGQVNPLALSDAYNDKINTTTVLANVNAAYKITPWLEYRLLVGVNYGTSSRKAEIAGWISGTGGNAPGKGEAAVLGNNLFSQTITHTLQLTKDITSDLNLNFLAGYEYWKTNYAGNQSYVYDFPFNLKQDTRSPIHYYDVMGAGKQANLQTSSFKEPTVEIQSYFGRANLNWKDKYLLTATLRSDGSSKFGSNNKYAYFPSVAAKWAISNEEFMKGNTIFSDLGLRVGYGQTGNQEFPSDAALDVYRYASYGSISVSHFANPNLKWEVVSSTDIGLDFTLFGGKIFGSVDYFDKKTKDPIVLKPVAQPTSGGALYTNLAGSYIRNHGVEILLGSNIVQTENVTWELDANLTLLKNLFHYPPAGNTVPFILTGALHGQGTSNAYAQAIANDKPVNVYYLPTFSGFDKDGFGVYAAQPSYQDDPNPKAYLGVNSSVTYKKLTLSIGLHGSFGGKLYNNTAESVLNINNIIGGKNIDASIVNTNENIANRITTSTRFLENGDYVKLHNATITYTFGDLGRALKNFRIYVAGNNLFVVSKFKGFDPEVNVDKALNGVPSLGIDYIGFPTQRTLLFGLGFTL